MGKPEKDTERETTPNVMLTRQEQELVALASQTEGQGDEKLFPTIESVKQLFSEQRMPLPRGLREIYPDHVFKWASIEKAAQHAQASIPWFVVTRTSHARFKSNLFGASGMIGFRGQNVLVYSSKKLHDELDFLKLLRVGKACKQATDANPTIFKDGRREYGVVENTNQTGSVYVGDLGPEQADFGPPA